MSSANPALNLFGETVLPPGFKYQADFLNPEEEHSLLQHVKSLPFRPFEFQGFTAKRRIVSFGWRYDFNGGGLTKTEDMPEFLSGLRARAESFAAVTAKHAATNTSKMPSVKALKGSWLSVRRANTPPLNPQVCTLGESWRACGRPRKELQFLKPDAAPSGLANNAAAGPIEICWLTEFHALNSNGNFQAG